MPEETPTTINAAAPPAGNINNNNGGTTAAASTEATAAVAAALTTPMGFAPSSTTTSAWTHWFRASLARVVAIVTYPCVVVFTIFSLLMVFTFCIFPTLLIMTLGICIYYCLMEDPIPLSVLLRYMLSPDPEDTAEYPNIYNLTQQRPVIQSKLIIRRVLQIDDIMDDDTKKELLYPRRHPFPIQVSTDHKCLYFSEPLVIMEENEDDSNAATADKGGGNNNSSSQPSQRPIESLPHYQRPYTTTDEEEQASSSPPTRQQQQQQQQQQRVDDVDNHDGDDHDVENPPDTTTTNGQEQLRAIDSSVETTCTTEDPPADNEVENDIVLSAGNDSETNADDIAVVETADNPSRVGIVITELEDDNDNDTARTTEHPLPPLNNNNPTPITVEDDYEDDDDDDYFGIHHDTRDRGTACDICLLDYQVGDAVAWSPNLDCSHTFHNDCVLDWLVRKPTCPNCRHNYLKGKHEDVEV
jgi:cell division septation protein DedD